MRLVLYIGLFILLIISALLWRFTCSFNDFGLNLFTELLGIGITVFFIEKILEKNRKNEKKPITTAALTDISLLVNRYVLFFQELYRNSVEEVEPNTLKDFLSTETFEKIWNNLDMNAKPLVYPEINMWTHLQNNAKYFHELGTKILDRHGWHLDSKTYKYIHDITESSIVTSWKDYIISIYNLDISMGYQRPKILASYSIEITKEELDSVYNLQQWCIRTSKELKGESDVHKVTQYPTVDYSERQFRYKKDPEKLSLEIENWNKTRIK